MNNYVCVILGALKSIGILMCCGVVFFIILAITTAIIGKNNWLRKLMYKML